MALERETGGVDEPLDGGRGVAVVGVVLGVIFWARDPLRLLVANALGAASIDLLPSVDLRSVKELFLLLGAKELGAASAMDPLRLRGATLPALLPGLLPGRLGLLADHDDLPDFPDWSDHLRP